MISRTRFAKEIVTEFLPAKNLRSKKVLILAHGMPSLPKKNELMKYFSELGYWVFFPRYRGTWESDGKFLQSSPHLDLLDVISGISKGFEDYWTGKKYQFKPSMIHLVGSSFGGSAVLLASADKRVEKVVALSPVIDWRVESVEEPLDWLGEFMRKAFGNAYRFKKADWKKLGTKSFFNPIDQAENVDGKKILLIHSHDDEIVPIEPAEHFAAQTACQLKKMRASGHLSLSAVRKLRSVNQAVITFLEK